VKNYRPIILLPAYGKIMEKLMKNALRPSISPLHEETQYVFTAGRSTIDVLWHFKNAVKRSTRKYVMTIFIDVKGILSCAVEPFRRVFSVLCV
jgi:hypothetical protein